MSDEMIKSILLELGCFSWAVAHAGSETALMEILRGDFQELFNMCEKQMI